MSTFNGIVAEFPRIRIDHFRQHGPVPPTAVFLSHIHSDHLTGLESLRSPPVYCSYATKELLLKIEKYPHRINFSKGILESRNQHYRGLERLMKPIPLHTPTEVELGPLETIRVTLFDANHCPGAVMFLIEGDGKAVLYTGDIRSEPWFVNALIRQPVMIPYTLGTAKLDKIYLDTTFAANDRLYVDFPSKAEGLRELLAAVAAWPSDTIFHFKAWTWGYEDVWSALASALNTKVHVDRYYWKTYKSLSKPFPNGIGIPEAHILRGFKFGNDFQKGCLTKDAATARIHSCDSGTACPGMLNRRVVSIVPIITRDAAGGPVPELGAGGGYGDTIQDQLELLDSEMIEELKQACSETIKDPKILANVQRMLSLVSNSKNQTLQLEEFAAEDTEKKDDIMLQQLIQVLSSREDDKHRSYAEKWRKNGNLWKEGDPNYASGKRPEIQFAYSRHSSYSELCALVEAFKPKDIHPCTVDERTWDDDDSMKVLFGHLCSEDIFAHDKKMYELLERRQGHPARKKVRREMSPEDIQASNQLTEDWLASQHASEGILGGSDVGHEDVPTGSRPIAHESLMQEGSDLIPDPEGTLERIRKGFEEATAGGIHRAQALDDSSESDH